MVMVKAFAYGTGLVEVSKVLAQAHVDFLGVVYLDEAMTLRRHGIRLPIVVMNPQMVDFDLFELNGIQAGIYSMSMLEKLIASSSSIKIHLKLETGMNRLGFSKPDIDKLVRLLSTNTNIRIEGIFTHFSSTDIPEEDEFTCTQAAKFEKMSRSIIEVIDHTPMRHALNSPGIVRFPEFHYDMVRLGIGLYGFDPTGLLNLDQVGSLKTYIAQIRKMRKGESVSYARSGRAKADMMIAILPIGYADGYLRIFGNGNAKVSIRNHLVPTIGNICMDMTMIDITGLEVNEGDEVVVFGNNPTIKQLAIWSDTIPYEMLTNVSQRVKRVYVGG